MLIDPNVAPTRALPRDIGDLQLSARNSHVLAYDNLSHLSDMHSDALCRLSTGSGMAKRMLYTDESEVIINVSRPIILNGVEELATRPDLLDRCVNLTLLPIAAAQRKTEAAMKAEFTQAQPGIFGALLDAVSAGLKNLPSVHLTDAPRMADFAHWAVACEPALGLKPGAFMAAYASNRAEANDTALEASSVGAALVRLLDGYDVSGWGNTSQVRKPMNEWEGPSETLLEKLNAIAPNDAKRQNSWPKNVKGLANAMRRIAPNLRAKGIEYELVRSRVERKVRISRKCVTDSQNVSVTYPSPVTHPSPYPSPLKRCA